MNKYCLSYNGKARFKRTKLRLDAEETPMTGGYVVLDYLYEYGARTVAEIQNHTGLTWNQVVSRLSEYIYWGYVEELAGE